MVEGGCLRDEWRSASAPQAERAAEWERFLRDPEVAAIIPPWGGELASELLESIDFASLRGITPKWVLGYSDISTLTLPLTLISRWATAHGPNLMEMAPTEADRLTDGALRVLSSDLSEPTLQEASDQYQTDWVDYAKQFNAPFQLTEQTKWKRLDGLDTALEFKGRLIGGCLDTIAWLAGSPYGDVPGFVERCGHDRTILFLENAEQSPGGLVRCLLSLRRHGWFENLAGLVFGRDAAPSPTVPNSLTHPEALRAVLEDAPFPVFYDVDIGHQPPQFTLINGAHATFRFESGGGTLSQILPAR